MKIKIDWFWVGASIYLFMWGGFLFTALSGTGGPIMGFFTLMVVGPIILVFLGILFELVFPKG